MYKALLLGPFGEQIKDSRIEFHGWATVSGNWSNARNSNLPTAYWIVPNSFQLDQLITRFEREADTVQTDHIDWGFRAVGLYGIDYRYTTAGGVFSHQLLYHNNLYGFDPVEFYLDLYVPWVFAGDVVRLGALDCLPGHRSSVLPRTTTWPSTRCCSPSTPTPKRARCPPSSSTSGTWFKLRSSRARTWPPGMREPLRPASSAGAGSPSNNDAFYTCLNNINDGKFRCFVDDSHKAGHDNFNYVVSTWEHRFSRKFIPRPKPTSCGSSTPWWVARQASARRCRSAAEAVSGKYLPGNTPAYGVLNYTMFQLSKRDYFTVRNEWWDDSAASGRALRPIIRATRSGSAISSTIT